MSSVASGGLPVRRRAGVAWASAAGQVTRALVATLAGLLVVVAATGWVFLLEPHTRSTGGPTVPDALPLYELSKHAAVPLVAFAAVWAVAALLLGLLARFARAERLTAALLLALGVGLWGYLASGVSILVIRQVPAHDAFEAAGQLRAVYLPAALAGLAGALTGCARVSVRPRSPLVLACFVAAAGLIGVVDGILPEHSRTLVERLSAGSAHPLTNALVAPVGLALIVVARGLARRRRRAWQVAVALLAGSTALHLLESFNLGAGATGLLALALVARRHDFDVVGEPNAQGRILGRALVFAGAIYGYAAAALWVNRLMADQPFTAGFAIRETTHALLGLSVRGSGHLTGGFDAWFGPSVFVAGLAAAGWLLFEWIAPWRYRLAHEARERELARDLVNAWGTDTLAPFVLRGDKSYFFSESERAFIAYKVVHGVAIVSGDPVGPPQEFARLVARFIEFAHERDWRVAVLGASERWLDELYRARGLHALYHGDEAVIDVDRFSLEGRPIRKVRQSVHRLERAGYSAEVLYPHAIGPELRRQLETIMRAWRRGEPSRGFVMALDALFRLEDDDAIFVVGRGPDGTPKGFLHFAISRPGAALSLSSMPRLLETPNGFNEWLVCEAVAWARKHGFGHISLNFAPFAALLDPEATLSGLERVQRRALLALKGHFQLDNLLLFNRKFFPRWNPRFVVYERKRDLPRIGIAALAAEAYLPFTGRDRR